MNSFEEILCAIAVKNSLLTRDEALEFLKKFDAQPMDKPARPIVEFMIEAGTLTLDQAAMLQNAAKKVMAQQVTARQPAPPAGPAPAATPPPPAGNPQEPIPGYRIKGKLGVGGTATVFLAEDRKRGSREVALKILQPALGKDPKALARFLREGKLLVDFNHPNLCKGFESGQAGPLAFVSMELLQGESVQDLIDREGPMSEARALEIILDTAKVLDYMQQKGIVHRDIKPGNIMVLADGTVKVCDLGFATPISGDGESLDEETTSGTVQYMAPEQARGQGLDIRADIYALGASLYHMVMGEVPFKGNDSMEVMAKQVLEALNSTELKNRRISRHMHYFIERMMSKDKSLRYANPKELVDDINEQIEGFRSLEYRPDEQTRRDSNVMRGLSGGTPPPGPAPKPTTRKFRSPTSRFYRRDR